MMPTYSIYVDKIWISCLVMDIYLLWMLHYRIHRKVKILRWVFFSALHATLFVLLLICPKVHVAVKLVLQCGICNLFFLWAAFSFRTKEMLLRTYLIMHEIALFLGGFLLCISYVAIKIAPGNLRQKDVLAIGFGIVIGITLFYTWQQGKKENPYYAVILDVYGTTLHLKGLYDSGNGLYDSCTGKAVVVANKDVLQPYLEKIPIEKHFMIPYHSIGKKHGMLDAVIVPKMRVEKGEFCRDYTQVMVGLCKDEVNCKNAYQIILHPQFV